MIWLISTFLCTSLFIFCLLDFLVKTFTNYKDFKTMPGPHMYPIIGAVKFFCKPRNKLFDVATTYVKRFPHGFAYWSFGVFVYHLYSAEALEKIVTNPKHIEKSFTYKFLHSLLGTGLLTSGGEKWFARRKLLTPAFHFNILHGFQSTFNDQTSILINWIRENELSQPEGTHLQKLISRFTLNTICESAMGVKLTRIDELDTYRAKINEIGKLHVERMVIPWYIFDWSYNLIGNGGIEHKLANDIHEFTGNVITTKRKSFISHRDQSNQIESADVEGSFYKKKQRFAMLDTLLRAEYQSKQIDANGIQEEVDTFVFEGFDTTMTAITFILFAIANHSDVQQQLYDEIQSKDHTNANDEHSYMDAVIKETLRLYPPVPFIGRTLGEEVTIGDLKLPAKTQLHVLIYHLHRDAKYFPDPEKFDPSRFLDKEAESSHPFAYIPFSAGQRNCIGQKFAMIELRTVVSEIMRNFYLKPITKLEDIVIISDLILRTKDPIRLHFIPRKT